MVGEHKAKTNGEQFGSIHIEVVGEFAGRTCRLSGCAPRVHRIREAGSGSDLQLATWDRWSDRLCHDIPQFQEKGLV
jgi:hypothetical protein